MAGDLEEEAEARTVAGLRAEVGAKFPLVTAEIATGSPPALAAFAPIPVKIS